MKTFFRIGLFMAIFLQLATAFPCTTFTFSDGSGHRVYGRNFDFTTGLGHAVVNPRNLAKTAFISPPEKPVSWVSKYGSITFNQNGREFPYGGMNEAGLVIEQMWLQESVYPPADDRYGLSELQWIQYQLDNCATVKEVIETDNRVRISYTSVATLHFLVSDAGGDAAVIEYLEGKMTVYHGRNLPYSALANCPYEVSLDYHRNGGKSSQKEYSDWTRNSSGRFSKAAGLLTGSSASENIVDFAFLVLDSVAQDNSTQWSIVYDITRREIHYKTRNNSDIRTLFLDAFDFACTGTFLFADMDDDVGKPEDFSVYSYESNFALIDEVCNNVDFLNENVTPEMRKMTARYPESVKCGE